MTVYVGVKIWFQHRKLLVCSLRSKTQEYSQMCSAGIITQRDSPNNFSSNAAILSDTASISKLLTSCPLA